MKLRAKSAVAGVTALAIAGAGLAFAAQANAYTGSGTGGAPSWVAGDGFRKGAVLFYDATGAQITGGSSYQSAAAFVGTSGTALRAGATKATAYLAAPDAANAIPSTWATNGMLSNYTFTGPPAGTPTFTPNAPGGFVKLNAAAAALGDVASGVQLYSGANTDYINILEIRVQDSGTGVVNDGGKYWATDIEYNPGTTPLADGLAAGAWKVVYPAAASVATTTTVTASPASPDSKTDITVTAHVSASNGGTVVFKRGGVAFSTKPVAASTATSDIAADVIQLPAGTYTNITADFTATAPAADYVGYGSSTGTLASYTVTQAPAHNVTVTLGSINSGAASVTQPANITGSAVVTDAGTDPANPIAGAVVTAGSVQFFDGAAATPFATDSNGADGFTFSVGSNGFSASATPGTAHSITAKFIPTVAVDYNQGTSAAGSINVIIGILAGNSPDTQYIQTTINPGVVTITTPYNSAVGALVLPAMSLDSTATGFTTSADFGNITVLDERPGNLPYDVFAKSSDLGRTAGTSALPNTVSTIDSHNVGLTGVGISTLTGAVTNIQPSTGNAVFSDNAAADWVAPLASSFPNNHVGLGGTSGQKILHVAHGLGSITIDGTLTIHAPTNTVDGTYTGTVTFSAFSA